MARVNMMVREESKGTVLTFCSYNGCMAMTFNRLLGPSLQVAPTWSPKPDSLFALRNNRNDASWTQKLFTRRSKSLVYISHWSSSVQP